MYFTLDVIHPYLSKLGKSRFEVALFSTDSCHILFHHRGVITIGTENRVGKPTKLKEKINF
jgi:hypothetical protein